MEKEKIDALIEKAIKRTEEKFNEIMGLEGEEREAYLRTAREVIRKLLDKKLEDWTDLEKLASSMHFRSVFPTMPHAQTWILDYFSTSVGFLVKENNVEEFCQRMEKLIDYIIDYRDSFLVDEDDK